MSWSNLRWDGICLIIGWFFLSVRYRRLRVVGLPPNFQRFEAHVWKRFFCGFLLPSSSGSLFSRGGLEVTGGSEKCKNPKSHHKLLHEFFRCPLHNDNVFLLRVNKKGMIPKHLFTLKPPIMTLCYRTAVSDILNWSVSRLCHNFKTVENQSPTPTQQVSSPQWHLLRPQSAYIGDPLPSILFRRYLSESTIGKHNRPYIMIPSNNPMSINRKAGTSVDSIPYRYNNYLADFFKSNCSSLRAHICKN